MNLCKDCKDFNGVCNNGIYANNRYRAMPEKLNENGDCFYFTGLQTGGFVKKKESLVVKEEKKKTIKKKVKPSDFYADGKRAAEKTEEIKEAIEIQPIPFVNNIILDEELKSTGSTE